MAAPAPSNFDGNQVLQHAFDESTGKIRVDAVLSPSGGATEVIISHEDDSIRLGDGVNLVTGTTVGSSFGIDVNVVNNGIAATPSVATLSMPLAGTEYNYTIPSNVKKIKFQSRLKGKINYSFTLGDIGSGVYFTISPGANEVMDTFVLSGATDIYVTSTKVADTLEILYWI